MEYVNVELHKVSCNSWVAILSKYGHSF